MFTVVPTLIADARIQLHWAAQLLSAAADATLTAVEDDSHTNFEWQAPLGRLLCRAGPSIVATDFSLHAAGEVLPLRGLSLRSGADWLAERINAPITFRDYDMPSHPVAEGKPFDPDALHLADIAAWFSFGQKALSDCGELRVWPHHFDLGFWAPSQVEGRSIGGGFSLGDKHIPYPYFYVNAYGVDRPDQLPPLLEGTWSEDWLGAVLPFRMLDDSGDVYRKVSEFVESGMNACRELIGF